MESFHNGFFHLIRPLDREQSGKGEIISESGEAPELGAAVDPDGVAAVASQMNLYRCDR
jgi:hypothetical protein